MVPAGRPGQATIAATMRSVRLHRPGGPEALALEQLATPRPRAGEALVRVHAAAITRDELEWPLDRLPATPSYELSGVVAALGQDVDSVAVGQPVYGLTGFDRDGVAADYVAVAAQLLAPAPRSLGHLERAAVPLAALSAWQGLFVHGALEAGQRVLIHGAAGGVGQFATQLARWRGAQVLGTTSPATADLVRQLGADQVLDAADPVVEDAVEPVDLVFDTVGGERLERSPAVVRPGGRLVSVAEEPPERVARAPIESRYFIVEPHREQLVELGRLIDQGALRVAIDSVFPLEQARAAFERSLAAGTRGKVVLRVADPELSGSGAGPVAVQCLLAWTTGDFATARSLLDDDVSFVGPLATTDGADAYIDGVRGLAGLVQRAEVRQVVADGDDACVLYDLVTDTPAGAVPTAGWYRVRGGKITSVRVFFDPRPFG